MARNAVFLVAITLTIVVLVFSYQLYQERQESSLRLDVGGKTISIEAR
jgi:predicted negative regulator of RcsB-dependent stress response